MYDASCQHKYEWVLDKVDFNLTFWADKYVYVITDTDRMMTYGQEIALQVSWVRLDCGQGVLLGSY